MTVLRAGGRTDVGRVRELNEDTYLVAEPLFAVADGMGGHQAGEVASQLAVEALQANLASAGAGAEALASAVRAANREVFERAAEQPELRGMGTTLCALWPVEGDGAGRVAVANVGDSRVYLYRDGELTRVTEDHSLVQELVREGSISREEAAVHPQRNVVTRALGLDPDVEVDVFEVDPVTGDRFVLCSDGLFDEVAEATIGEVLGAAADPEDAAATLVRLANEQGGHDNTTVVVVDVVDAPAPPAGGTRVERPLPADTVHGPPEDGSDGVGSRDDRYGSDRSDGGAGGAARSRVFTWRVLVFALALGLVVGAAVAAVGWYARGTYFVSFDDGAVAVFRGRPGGVLWFDPTLELRFPELRREQVPLADRARLEAGKEEPSLDAARRFVANLHRRAERLGLLDEEPDGVEPDSAAPDGAEGTGEPAAGTREPAPAG